MATATPDCGWASSDLAAHLQSTVDALPQDAKKGPLAKQASAAIPMLMQVGGGMYNAIAANDFVNKCSGDCESAEELLRMLAEMGKDAVEHCKVAELDALNEKWLTAGQWKEKFESIHELAGKDVSKITEAHTRA
jgi:hypothetical protein